MLLPYFNPLAWCRWLGRFVAAWVATMPWRRLRAAAPAMLLMTALLLAGFAAYGGHHGWRHRLLDRQLADAWQVDDFATAELILRRQLEQRPGNAEARYRLAIARDGQDAREEALAMMRRLVAEREHEPAARWIVRTAYDGGRGGARTPQQRSELGRLLALIHRESPDDRAIQACYADHLVRTERWAEAVELLIELAPAQPMRGLQAAVVSRRLGRDASAKRLADQTLAELKRSSAEDPADAGVALATARCQLFLEKFPDALRTLDAAIKRGGEPEEEAKLRRAVGDGLVAWIGSLKRSGEAAESTAKRPARSPAQQRRVLQMLQVALRYAPDHPRVLTLVADEVLASDGSGDRRVAARRRALVEGAAPGVAHFIRGTAALVAGDTEAGAAHLEIAAELMPGSAAILNNLAVALSQQPRADLEHALAIAERSIAQSERPRPHFYDTRGQIRYRLGRYTEAIADLERALAAESLRPAAHRTLAKCYAALGDEELSREHEKAAAQWHDSPSRDAEQ